jgi:hypothetical protein
MSDETAKRDRKLDRLAELRDEVARLEKDIGTPPAHWQARDYYAAYHATSGLLLGMIGAFASLLFNVVGSLAVNQHPLRLIQIYLTFPLGEKALAPEFDTGIALAVGCCLYVGTGMLLGIPFQMAFAKFMPESNLGPRLILATVLGLAMWAINFYGILSWLQPMLFGGSWIVDPALLPPWVGAATHLVFAWTLAIIFPWGKYEPYRRQTEAS